MRSHFLNFFLPPPKETNRLQLSSLSYLLHLRSPSSFLLPQPRLPLFLSNTHSHSRSIISLVSYPPAQLSTPKLHANSISEELDNLGTSLIPKYHKILHILSLHTWHRCHQLIFATAYKNVSDALCIYCDLGNWENARLKAITFSCKICCIAILSCILSH